MINPSDKGKGAKKEKFKLKHLLRKRLKKKLGATPVDVLSIAQKFPVKDQGSSESCGGQAWSYYIQTLKYLRDNSVVELSAKDIYSHCYLDGGGSSEDGLINQVENNGVAYESDISSYINGQPPTEPFMEVIQARVGTQVDNAEQQIIYSPRTFDGNDINQVKMAIDQGNGCVVAIYGNNACWQTSNGVVEVPDSASDCPWGHWLNAVDYNDTTHFITVKNSWGAEAGLGGYYFIPYSYFSNGLVMGAWTMELEPSGYYVGLWETLINIYQNIIQKIKNG